MRMLSCLRNLLVCFAMCSASLTTTACGDDSDDGSGGAGGSSGASGASGMSGAGGGGGSDEPEADCDGDVPSYAEVSAFDKCVQCHSSEISGGSRGGAPSSVNFDTYEAARGQAQNAVDEVFIGNMPLPGSGVTISPAERQALIAWGLCGTPE